ncbi:ABC transporter ATP-binding protein [Chrysiogenes arsenatis]|uniref:ABC transporter ATP-binding protein n=1 Tax=Chrysiogenes arsenatis TaxID=309797 RepID=UPI0004065685|nr:ABC transporter ATP-binding protein [Chrysiogenes arsenatis]
MIVVQGLHFGYGRTSVLRDISFRVERGEILTILGPNGCGKSTLLGLLRGVLTPQVGVVEWEGRQPHQIGRRDMARLCAVVPQSAEPAFGYTAGELVAMGRFARIGLLGSLSPFDRQAVKRALELTDTAHLQHRPVTQLSGGERQRVYLARAFAQGSPTLMLDEATSHLDMDHRWETAELLRTMNREHGVTIVQVSHDLDLAAAISHRIVLLESGGTVVAVDTPSKVFTPENLGRAFRMEVLVETDPHTGTPRVVPIRSLRFQGREHL